MHNTMHSVMHNTCLRSNFCKLTATLQLNYHNQNIDIAWINCIMTVPANYY